MTASASGSLNPAAHCFRMMMILTHRGVHTRQIEEIWILVKVIEDVASTINDVGSSNYCYGIGRQLCRELRSPLRILDCGNTWCDCIDSGQPSVFFLGSKPCLRSPAWRRCG